MQMCVWLLAIYFINSLLFIFLSYLSLICFYFFNCMGLCELGAKLMVFHSSFLKYAIEAAVVLTAIGLSASRKV